MRASEAQRIIKQLETEPVKIPKKKSYEDQYSYDYRVRRLQEIQAIEEIEAEQNPMRRRRMWYLFDNGILDFSNV